jgi:hypothetical protein
LAIVFKEEMSMHIEFQNGAAGEYNNISKITVNNEMERDILREAISEFIKQDKAVTKCCWAREDQIKGVI